VSLAAVDTGEHGVRVRSDVPAAASDAYVDAHPAGTGYHQHAWLGVIERSFGHETRYLVAESAGGIAGVLPLVFFRSRLFGSFAVSLPFLNYGGVLADSPGGAEGLLAAAIEATRAAGGAHLELRHSTRQFESLSPKRHKVAMLLPLAGSPELQWDALDRKVRNQVRKGEKSSLTPHIGGAELVGDFYTVFAHNMRDLGTPVYGRRFFEAVIEAFPRTSRVFVVRHEGKPVAGSIVVWHRGTAEVPWASALRSSNALSANVFLYWEMLRFCVEQRLTLFDFGRSTPNEGTFHFKKQWGAEPRQLVWEYWTAPGVPVPNLNPKNPKFDIAIRAWQRLPVPVATRLGPHIVRNIP
jgi:FemAB-related protein (PEP-CTERM system-associated)